MTKRTQSKSPEPHKKAKVAQDEGGFKGMDCPFSKSVFLSNAKEITIEMELKPIAFGADGFGFQKSGGIKKIEASGANSHGIGEKAAYVRPNCIAHIMNTKDSNTVTKEVFMSKATPLHQNFVLHPVEFSSGNFGWSAYQRANVKVDDKQLVVQINFNAPINKSNESSDEGGDPVTASIDADAIKQYLPIIGEEDPKNKDDLTKLRGIGPWIEKRLNKIKIYKFRQLARMTAEIEEAVNKAIKHFHGRVRRDEWVLQAQKIEGGDWDKLNPLVSKATGKVQIDGEKYERKLIEIAKSAMADAHIEHFEAEALWFSASDGNKVTPSEKKTLDYIMTSDKYKVDDDAKAYLKAKLQALDARGVITS